MLRLLSKKKSLLTAPIKPIFRSIVHPRQNFFSNTFLEEGEYIEGDFDVSTTSPANRPELDPNTMRKKFVGLENFENNLVRKTLKPKAEAKQGIANSVASLKDKLKFELAADDEFAQSLKKRQKPQEQQPSGVQKAEVKNKEQIFKAAIEKVYKEVSPQELQAKNLTKIEFKELTPEAREYDPLRIYQRNQMKTLIDNAHKSNEAVDEYLQGEEGVDYIHPAESLTKLYGDIHNEMMNEVYEGKLMETPDSNDRHLLEEWRLENGVSDVDFTGMEDDPIPYPGSSKGPSPNDDPEFFAEWLFTNMPPATREFYRELEEESGEDRDALDGPTGQIGGYETIILSEVPNSELYLTRASYGMVEEEETGQGMYHSTFDNDLNSMSPMPDAVDIDYQAAQTVIEKWTMFRMYPVITNWMRMLHNTIDDINNGRIQGEEKKLHSLFRYYNLLPEFVRKNPIIINTVRCLEFAKHDMTLEQKEIALNMACEFTIPLTAYEEDCYAEAVISTKRNYTIWEEKTLLKLDEDKEVRGERKKNVVPLALMDMRILEKVPENAHEIKNWNTPPQMDPHIPEEDPHPVLPLDFYDNDDGFWDDYIEHKEQQYGSFPLLTRRPYFKHH